MASCLTKKITLEQLLDNDNPTKLRFEQAANLIKEWEFDKALEEYLLLRRQGNAPFAASLFISYIYLQRGQAHELVLEYDKAIEDYNMSIENTVNIPEIKNVVEVQRRRNEVYLIAGGTYDLDLKDLDSKAIIKR
jgi:tetratricopeptide (TPR) repeat protein